MQQIITAKFESANGPVQMLEVMEYSTDRDGNRTAKFKATDGKHYIANLSDITVQAL